MTSPRQLARMLIPVVAGAALVGGAPTVVADSADATYLAQLHTLGFSWSPEHDQALIGMAHLVCDDLYWGWTQNQIAQQTHENLDSRGVTFGQVGSMVDLARTTYCPYLTPQS